MTFVKVAVCEQAIFFLKFKIRKGDSKASHIIFCVTLKKSVLRLNKELHNLSPTKR